MIATAVNLSATQFVLILAACLIWGYFLGRITR